MTRIFVIGAGKGGKALLELFHKEASVEIAGVADKNARAPGMLLARELGLRVCTDYREIL
jgi:FlaA1/EpsC-like NDP-sugar epimerase